MGVQTFSTERNALNATAARERRRTSSKHRPLPPPLQRELDQARVDRDRAISTIRGTFVQRDRELDRERRREERLAWERYRLREAEIRARAGETPLDAISKPEPLPATPALPIYESAAAFLADQDVADEAAPLARRRWWHRLAWWRPRRDTHGGSGDAGTPG